MQVIGIDIGTTSICGVVLDTQSGKLLCARTENSEAFMKTENSWEKIQDVPKILAVANRILENLLAQYHDVAAIGVTGQMHGIVYVDGRGEAVSPLYTWQDGRGDLSYENTTYAKHLGSCAGYGNVTDFYNRANGLVPESAVNYCTIQDYFVMQLCGNAAPLLHASDAASLGLYDPENKSFHYDYAPQITDSFAVAGSYRGIPVSVAIGDNQASVFATLADEEALLVNIGTGSQISLVADKPVVAPNIESRPYVDGKYLIVGSALCGGRAYSLLKDFYKAFLDAAGVTDADVYGVMAKLCRDKDTASLHVDTRFAGTREDPNLRGSITGISTENLTPSELTLGVLQGMMEELYTMYLSMGQTRKNIIGSGNGLRKNATLCRVAERIFEDKLLLPVYTEEAACGAALFALVACGKYPSAAAVQTLVRYEVHN